MSKIHNTRAHKETVEAHNFRATINVYSFVSDISSSITFSYTLPSKEQTICSYLWVPP